MTKHDREILLHFITRTNMYIYPVDLYNIRNFITGYEIGRKNKCQFFSVSKQILETKYKIKYPATGWFGQIEQLSKKQSLSNVLVFNKIALETIAESSNGKFDVKLKNILKERIINLIVRITEGDSWFDVTWIDMWLSLNNFNTIWYKDLWSENQYRILKSINNEVKNYNLFKNEQIVIKYDKLLKLKQQFINLQEVK